MSDSAGPGYGRVQSGCKSVESRRRTFPAQLLHVIEKGNVRSKGGELAEQHCLIALSHEGVGEGSLTRDIYSPLAEVGGIDSRCPNLARTAADDLAPQPRSPG